MRLTPFAPCSTIPFSMILITMILCLMPSGVSHGWGARGHAATGILAMRLADDTARRKLDDILGSTDNERIDELCNWPDTEQESAELEGLKPQHYVNIPRAASNYDAERDCRGGLCITEAIKKYADQLGNEGLPQEKRWRAFAWLCHLVGDLHQPLHCGLAGDRGGNTIEVAFLGDEMNLHQFWDYELIANRAGSTEALVCQLEASISPAQGNRWNPEEVNGWTMESHNLALTRAYPPESEIDAAFADQSWDLITERLPLGSERLARILNATLGNGEVVLVR